MIGRSLIQQCLYWDGLGFGTLSEGGCEIAEELGSRVPEVVANLVLGKIDLDFSGCGSRDFLEDLFQYV